MFWQLTIDANDPASLARFWARALGYHARAACRSRRRPGTRTTAAGSAGEAAFTDRLFDPSGLRPPIWFQEVPEDEGGQEPDPPGPLPHRP